MIFLRFVGTPEKNSTAYRLRNTGLHECKKGEFQFCFPGKLIDLIGRKNSLLACNVILLTGWIIIAWAPSVTVICVGRFLGGLAASAIAISCKSVFPNLFLDHAPIHTSILLDRQNCNH